MTTEIAETTKKSKRKHFKKEKRKLKNVEDQEQVIKKKRKIKKAKKDKANEIPEEKTEQEDVDQMIEENTEVAEEEGEERETELKKKPSKRQTKKEKFIQRVEIARESSKQDNAQKALNYVSMWKHAKEQWKFNKVKQIWLIDNLLDEKYIPEEHYSTILEYFEGSRGLARQKLIDKAMKIIKKVEDSIEEDEEIVETTEYKRARQLLQALPNET